MPSSCHQKSCQCTSSVSPETQDRRTTHDSPVGPLCLAEASRPRRSRDGSVRPSCHHGIRSFHGHLHTHCLFQPVGVGAAAWSSKSFVHHRGPLEACSFHEKPARDRTPIPVHVEVHRHILFRQIVNNKINCKKPWKPPQPEQTRLRGCVPGCLGLPMATCLWWLVSFEKWLLVAFQWFGVAPCGFRGLFEPGVARRFLLTSLPAAHTVHNSRV